MRGKNYTPMKNLMLIMTVFFHVANGGSINQALDSARAEYHRTQDSCVIRIEPGTYYEELTIDIPNLTLLNASKSPSIAVNNHGVGIDANAVRISWYYGHGYQYRSMGDNFNYGGKRTRCWNASVLVTAPNFRADNIIFENSFNLYVSPAELQDSLWDISQTENDWTANERPKKVMPQRPREAYSTEVQKKLYNERAAALSFTSQAGGVLNNCRLMGHQDVLYGDHGAHVEINGGAIQGTVDFIFGGMDLTVRKTEIIVGCSAEKNNCYIAAGRGYVHGKPIDTALVSDSVTTRYGKVPVDELAQQGMIFKQCSVRYATTGETAEPGAPLVYLARPWRWWGKHVFINMNTSAVKLHPDLISLGLTKGTPAPWCEIKYEAVSAHRK